MIRLNKFLSSAGVASRRKCDELISLGKISVNGKVETQLGVSVDENKDKVCFDGKLITLSNKFVYYKLHKPKGYICSANDEKGRIYSFKRSKRRSKKCY